MQLLELTLPSVAENLALDEALLDEAEAKGASVEVLRIWESPQAAVVLGRSSKYKQEAEFEACERDGIPILRRSSGGCAVLIGPGCLMYSVVLSYERHPELQQIDLAHVFVLERVRQAVAGQASGVAVAGTSDLVFQPSSAIQQAAVKFSGNSLRCKRTHLLYHGTLLYAFDLSLIGKYLASPPREPEYRLGRRHGDFVQNLPLAPSQLRAALRKAFGASREKKSWPEARVNQLVAERYGLEAWHRER